MEKSTVPKTSDDEETSKNKETSGSRDWWWILLISFIILFVAALGFVLVKRMKSANANVNNTSLRNNVRINNSRIK